MSNGLSERGLIIVSAIVWFAIAASIAFIVAYAGIDGIPFAFVVLIVAIPVWARVIRERNKAGADLERQITELSNRISELSAKIEELKKAMEE
ncbi:hypothetical protein [Vulcanisaeta souniana]|uniref:Uncharacterized protein n=1 Tax=Vulcanisaeta souniana JCM 11219 TaxID=1293586 RepID=A0A830EE49_9CREN|nr:hypothetical protein [Vulcanisaeta souniana]BDR91528.1 hypothetical protein Vsou_06210 [Vulcanisaeta souniana JCM 11219]GGI73901.1 hypothetical protein GCM10007112_08400 [Vulcanisaeta souniana JCM 11219]